MNTENPYSYDGSNAPTRQSSTSVDLVYWIPDESVTLHNGRPIPRTMLFPYAPPPEIGRVLSADGHHGRNFLAETVGVIVIACTMAYVFMYKVNAIAVALVLTAALSSFFRSASLSRYFLQFLSREGRKFPAITYVGELGFAEYFRQPLKGGIELKLFLYEHVESIRNGLCYDRSDRALFAGFDLEEATNKEPAATPYEIAIGRAVSNHFVRRWQNELNSGNKIQILFGFQEVLLITAAQIDFYHRYGCQKNLNKNDILKISLTYDGHLMFYLHEHLCPANHGRFKYSLNEISNPRAVLLFIPWLLGVPLLGKRLQ